MQYPTGPYYPAQTPYMFGPFYAPNQQYPQGWPQPTFQQNTSRMVARGNDPWISVSLLSEHLYCPRAGVIQHELPEENFEDKFRLFHLGRRRRTFYDLRQIGRALKRCIGFFVVFVVAAIASYIFGDLKYEAAAKQFGPHPPLTPEMWIPVLIALALMLPALFCLVRFIEIFLLNYIPARLAGSGVPDPLHQESQQVKWWKFINAGFRLVNPQDQYRDEQWHLVGNPWRILVKGDLRIPVFRRRPSHGTSGAQLYRQHYGRMAAYCHLIEKCEGAWSPYGIVLQADSYKAQTVPYQPGSRKVFHDGLVDARQTLKLLPQRAPAVPSNTQVCLLCPHSRRDPLSGYSVCGQRFSWNPPDGRTYYGR